MYEVLCSKCTGSETLARATLQSCNLLRREPFMHFQQSRCRSARWQGIKHLRPESLHSLSTLKADTVLSHMHAHKHIVMHAINPPPPNHLPPTAGYHERRLPCPRGVVGLNRVRAVGACHSHSSQVRHVESERWVKQVLLSGVSQNMPSVSWRSWSLIYKTKSLNGSYSGFESQSIN